MATITASFTDPVTILSPQALARGSTARGTIDLRSSFGCYLFLKIGRGGTTAIAGGTLVGLKVMARRLLNNDVALAGAHQPVGAPMLLSTTTAANSTTVNVDSASGQPALNVASITGFASEDLIAIQDSGGGFTRLEFHRVSKTAAGVLTLDRNLQFSHTAAQADTVRNKADVFAPIWLAGGSTWAVVFDYGDATAGDTAVIAAFAQQYTTESVA